MINNEGFTNKYTDWKKKRQEVEHRQGQWVQDELTYNPKPHQSKEDFYSQVSKANSLTKSEFEDLFWTHLVHIGWRIDDESVVLICQECDLPLMSIFIKSINQEENTKVSYLKNPTKHLQKHEKFCITEKPL
jgi:hypothetical protein